ncbi:MULTISPECIES: GDSL-type esterase/lipase family protein [unclassified Moraxella]|uniref:GDSL-type esterase/lipase family protein n=1 Tax=unclassified Moraxella TaxID=2685852 RepID=UPI003AF75F07
MNRRKLLLAGLTLPLLISCSKPKNAKIPSGSKVIALGDSLTFGYGATPETAYPTVLANKTGWEVINEGVSGDTSEGVLKRLDKVIEVNPKLLLLGIGGNDVLQRVAPTTTTSNINQIIDKLKSANIPMVLIAEPYFSTSALLGVASDNPIYEQIAKDKDVILFAKGDGGWSKILSDEKLKSDQIHANAEGYAKFAENLYAFLKELGFV